MVTRETSKEIHYTKVSLKVFASHAQNYMNGILLYLSKLVHCLIIGSKRSGLNLSIMANSNRVFLVLVPTLQP